MQTPLTQLRSMQLVELAGKPGQAFRAASLDYDFCDLAFAGHCRLRFRK